MGVSTSIDITSGNIKSPSQTINILLEGGWTLFGDDVSATWHWLEDIDASGNEEIRTFDEWKETTAKLDEYWMAGECVGVALRHPKSSMSGDLYMRRPDRLSFVVSRAGRVTLASCPKVTDFSLIMGLFLEPLIRDGLWFSAVECGDHW